MPFMKLKKHLIEKGIDKAEVDKCPGKPEMILLAVNKGLVEGEDPPAPAPAPANVSEPPPEPAPEPASTPAGPDPVT